MPKNNNDNLKWLDETGNEEYSLSDVGNVKNEMARLGAEFFIKVAENVRKFGLINTGALLDPSNMKAKVIESGEYVDRQTLELWMVEYADYINKGVKGVRFSKNAPDSPYQFKNYGMSEKGRKNIIQSVKDGKMKVRNMKYEKIGLERKASTDKSRKKSVIEAEAEQIIYNIKKYGIKKTNYFGSAFDEVFKDFGQKISEAVGKDIVVRLKQGNQ
jgi:hypothetical protein